MRVVASHLWPKDNWKLRVCVVASVSFVLIGKATRVAVPFWFRGVVDALAPTSASAAAVTVGPIALGVFGMVAAYGLTKLTTSLTDEMKTAIFAPVGAHAATNVSLQLFKKIHSLDLTYHLSRQTGVVSKDIDRGSRAFWSLAYSLLFMVLPTALEMVLVGGALGTQAGSNFVITAVVAVVSYVGWTYVVTNWRAKYREQYNQADSKVGGMMVDSLLNYETVKFFGREEFEQKRIGADTRVMNSHLSKLDQTMAVLNFGQQAIFAIAATSSLYFSTTSVIAGTMSVGDLVLVDALLLQLYQPLSWLGMLYRELQTSTQNMAAMIKLMDEESLVKELPEAKPFKFEKGLIELRNVTFGYPTKAASDEANEAERCVMKNLSLTIPGGSCVAFVGPSGCGKSTIFRLLYRFFDPIEGTVLFDGQDIKSLQMHSFREHIGVVPQDTVLFNDSVRYNIRYGNLNATDEEVENAARAANVHDSIMGLSEKYSTVVGERGLKLSGGEKQRVAIARAFLYNAPILLADEATSALDSKTEQGVMRTLKSATCREGSQRTIVIIAHRLTTVKDADIIFVLNGTGGLAEQGTHQELLDKGGLYYNLWNQQLQEKVVS